MQMRLRPKLERMEEIRRDSERSGWNAIQRDIKETVRRKQQREDMERSGPLLACQIMRRLEERPGWDGLLAELREGAVVLEPIEVEGFYVIKSVNDSKGGRVNVN